LQVKRHELDTQAGAALATPVEQTVEHEPQLFGSLVVSAQPLVQSVGVVLGQFEASWLELPDELPDEPPEELDDETMVALQLAPHEPPVELCTWPAFGPE
jgi:hypothetical protein